MRKLTASRGDTIIEVLFAMTIIGLTLGGAFGIANRSLLEGRASQERVEALKLAESQLELLRAGYEANVGSIKTRNASFCLEVNAALQLNENSGGACNDADVTGAYGAGRYDVEIEVPSGGGPANQYEIVIGWEPINTRTNEKATLSLYYRPKE